MSFTEAINKAKAAETAVGEKAPNPRTNPSPPKTQSPVPVASHRGNRTTAASAEDEDEDEDEDITMRIPGSFDVEDYDDGGVAMGADAISVLGDLWRRMQLR